MAKLMQRIRKRQIRVCSRWLSRLGRVPPPLRPGLHLLTGYRRPFATLAQAQAAIAGYDAGGHASPENAHLHLQLSAKPRPSDYPALFHINSIPGGVSSVFDLGGNVGNLYYCYSERLRFGASLIWRVFDVPEMLATGRELAAARGERRLRFTDSLADAEGVNLLIASGSLHYFERPLPDLIAGMRRKPEYVLVNRTPLLETGSAATVQDAGNFLVACKLYGKAELIGGFEKAGYTLADSWRVDELSAIIPGYPELSVPAYTGMFFRLSGRARGAQVLGTS